MEFYKSLARKLVCLISNLAFRSIKRTTVYLPLEMLWCQVLCLYLSKAPCISVVHWLCVIGRFDNWHRIIECCCKTISWSNMHFIIRSKSWHAVILTALYFRQSSVISALLSTSVSLHDLVPIKEYFKSL